MNKQLSKHFNEEEFRCRDGSIKPIDKALIEGLERLRELAGNKSIHINSGYRSPTYNKKIGGAPRSQHVQGKAADITIAGFTPRQVAELAEKVPRFRNGGIGIYDTFTHVDVRKGAARWTL
jgi:uncharacterized protein YcbK (DUF882 family)